MSPQSWPTCHPKNDRIRDFQASLVADVDWKKPTRII